MDTKLDSFNPEEGLNTLRLEFYRRAAERDICEVFNDQKLRRVFPIWFYLTDGAELYRDIIRTSLETILFSEDCTIVAFAPEQSGSALQQLFVETNVPVHASELKKKCSAIAEQLKKTAKRVGTLAGLSAFAIFLVDHSYLVHSGHRTDDEISKNPDIVELDHQKADEVNEKLLGHVKEGAEVVVVLMSLAKAKGRKAETK